MTKVFEKKVIKQGIIDTKNIDMFIVRTQETSAW